jgi:O-antigen ligase
MIDRETNGGELFGPAKPLSPTWTFWGIATVLVVVVLPYERFAGPASTRLMDGIVILLALYLALNCWRTRTRLVVPLLAPMLLILLSSLAATILGFAYSTNITAVIQELYLWGLVIVMTNVLLQHPLPSRNRLLKIWVVVACVVALTTLMGMLRIGPAMFHEIPYRDRYQFTGLDRGVGTYVNPNAAAAYLSISFFIALGVAWPVGCRALVCGWFLVGMYGTGSNGAMGTTLAAFGLLVVYATILRQRQRIWAWAAFVSGGTAVAILLVDKAPALFSATPFASSSVFTTNVRRISRAMRLRFELWDVGWQAFQERPWGIGPNSASEIKASLHSDYLAFLIERGPLGFLGWLLLLLEPLIYAARAAQKSRADPAQQWQMLALGAGILATALNATVHELSHTRPFWLLMAFIFAQSIALLRPLPQPGFTAKSWPSLSLHQTNQQGASPL